MVEHRQLLHARENTLACASLALRILIGGGINIATLTFISAAEMKEIRGIQDLAPNLSALSVVSDEQLLSLLPSALGLDADARFKLTGLSALPNNAGKTVRLDQTYRGVPIWSHQVVVQLSQEGRIVHLGGTAVFNINAVETTEQPGLTSKDAISASRSTFETGKPPGSKFENEQSQLVYYFVEKTGALRLAYKVSFFSLKPDAAGKMQPTNPVFFVDANTGAVIHTYDDLRTTGR
jgi:Zn-dependent metalloprotease